MSSFPPEGKTQTASNDDLCVGPSASLGEAFSGLDEEDVVLFSNPSFTLQDPIHLRPSKLSNVNLTSVSSINDNNEGRDCTLSMEIQDGVKKLSIRETMSSPQFTGKSQVNVEDESTSKGLMYFHRFLSDDHLKQGRMSSWNENKTLVKDIIKRIKNNLNNRDVILRDLDALHDLSIDGESRDLLVELGAVRVAVQVIRVNIDDSTMIRKVAPFLVDVCEGSKNGKVEFGRAGGVQVLIDCFRYKDKLSTSCMERICQVLSRLCSSCSFNLTLAGNGGAIKCLCEMIFERTSCASIQIEYVRTLHALSAKHVTNCQLVIEGGGFEQVIRKCRDFPFDEEYQTNVLELLHGLLHQIPSLRLGPTPHDLIDHLTCTLPFHYTSQAYIISSSTALRYLSFSGAVRRAVSRTGIIQTLCLCLSYHGTVATLVPVMHALGNLTYSPCRSKVNAIQPTLVESVQTIMCRHGKHIRLMTHMVRLLRNISDTRRWTKHGLLVPCIPELVIGAMQALPGVAGIQEHGAATLLNLSKHDTKLIRLHTPAFDMERHLLLHKTDKRTYKQLTALNELLHPGLLGLGRVVSGKSGRVYDTSSSTSGDPSAVLCGAAVDNAVAALCENLTEY